MASLSVTNTLQAGTTITAAAHNQNYSDIVNYINARNSGGTKWEGVTTSGNLSVDGTSTLTGNATFSALALLPVGSASAPSLTITGDTNTGIYSSVADQLDFATGGSQRFAIASTLVTSVVNFCVPSGFRIFLDGGTDTYLRESSGNVLDVVCGGTTAASFTSAGSSLLGTTTNNDASAGFVGEYAESIVSTSANTASSGTFGNITSISLTAGDWDVTGLFSFDLNGATLSGAYDAAISIHSGNTTTDHVLTSNVVTTSNANVTFAELDVPSYRLSLSATTTVYLKALARFSAGTPKVAGTIRARRVR